MSVEKIARAGSFGAAVAVLRMAKNLTQRDVAEMLSMAEQDLRDIERNLALGSAEFATILCRALGLSAEESDALILRRAQVVLLGTAVRRGECLPCKSGETGWMHVGAGERQDDCERVARCLEFITRHFPKAETCHCPAKCSGFVSLKLRLARTVAGARKEHAA